VILFPFFVGLDCVERLNNISGSKFNNPLKELLNKNKKNNVVEDVN
jgi:hypothetical protein